MPVLLPCACPHTSSAPPPYLCPTLPLSHRCIHPFSATTSPEMTHDDDAMSDARRDEETGLRVSFKQRKLEATRSAYEEQVGAGGLVVCARLAAAGAGAWWLHVSVHVPSRCMWLGCVHRALELILMGPRDPRSLIPRVQCNYSILFLCVRHLPRCAAGACALTILAQIDLHSPVDSCWPGTAGPSNINSHASCQ